MNHRGKFKGGYVGLLGLLITITLITFLVWRSDLFGAGPKQQTVIEQDKAAIESAEAAKQLIEKHGSQTNEQL